MSASLALPQRSRLWGSTPTSADLVSQCGTADHHRHRLVLHPRLQTWFPFNIQICLNGREWLAHQMDQEGIGYERQGNCFVWIEDLTRAQALLDAPLRADWPQQLDRLKTLLAPVLEETLCPFVARYYWTCHAREWTPDLLFTDAHLLRRLDPRFVQQGITTLASPDVLRFLGKPLTAKGEVPPAFRGEITSDLKRRAEGTRIKHRCQQNSLQAYDQAYSPLESVLRIETTLNDPTDFKVFRPKAGGPTEELDWRPLRKGVADLHRRAQVCQKAKERYLDALASVDTSQTLPELTEPMARPTTYKDRRVRGIHAFAAEDAALLEAVSRGSSASMGSETVIYNAASSPPPPLLPKKPAVVVLRLRENCVCSGRMGLW